MAAGNWKMNGLRADLNEVSEMEKAASAANCDVLLCVPATLISGLNSVADNVLVGAQNCHTHASGAHTGDISADMLRDAGAEYVVLGHSERRSDHGETDNSVRDRTSMAWQSGLKAIVCVGESLDQREASNTLDIIGGQLAGSIPDQATGENLVVAYEPIWAIGTGLTPTTDQIGEVHDFIRIRLERRFGEGIGRSVRILYGGSMNANNVAEISAVSNVDGGLVGGASLKAADFNPIIKELG
jgi:triosephosphate isomerase